jgi:hypothetical protein
VYSAVEPALHAFLRSGGFVYVSADNEVLQLTSLTPTGAFDDEDGLGFLMGRPAPEWWIAELERQGRMHPITLRVLHDEGATHFAWMKPFETLPVPPDTTLAMLQPDHPDGSFVYRMRSGHHWFFPVAPNHAARKRERQVFVAEISRYDDHRRISYEDRLRSYMLIASDCI